MKQNYNAIISKSESLKEYYAGFFALIKAREEASAATGGVVSCGGHASDHFT